MERCISLVSLTFYMEVENMGLYSHSMVRDGSMTGMEICKLGKCKL